jgi:hypothetical protein
MIDLWNRVTTNITIATTGIVAKVTSTVSNTPAKFPTVAVEQIDNRDTAMDLENSETAAISVMRIQVFSNKNITEARNISSVICDAMREMGYHRTFGPEPILNEADVSIFRTEMRFQRIVCSLDDIPRFATT